MTSSDILQGLRHYSSIPTSVLTVPLTMSRASMPFTHSQYFVLPGTLSENANYLQLQST
jgi:hypothetical protein